MMEATTKRLKTCPNGHQFYKTSDCPVCPICENEQKPKQGFLAIISAPARRALAHTGIATLQQLSNFTEKEVKDLHGIGPNAVEKLKAELTKSGLAFKK